MKMFSITGWSGSGKTTVITRLIQHFTSANKRVVAVKNAPDKYYLEPETKDTFKFLAAGTEKVYLAAKKELLTMQRVENKTHVFALLEKEVNHDNCDILLLEGLRRDDIPMIEIFNSTVNDSPKFSFDQSVAIISDKPVTDEIPNFNRDNINEISTFMEAYHE